MQPVHTLTLRGITSSLVSIRTTMVPDGCGITFADLPRNSSRGIDAEARILSALKSVGVTLDGLGAHITWDGAADDMPSEVAMAVSLLQTWNHLNVPVGVGIVGALSYGGELVMVRGIIPLLLGAAPAGLSAVIVPSASELEASQVPGCEALLASSFQDLIESLRDHRPLPKATATIPYGTTTGWCPDMSELELSPQTVRTLEIAATGRHNIMVKASSGISSTAIARRITGILPAIPLGDGLMVNCISSLAGLFPPTRVPLLSRPFRAPHHSVSLKGLCGLADRPGELQLANHGCLLLDEADSFSPFRITYAAKALREGTSTFTNNKGTVTVVTDVLVVVTVGDTCESSTVERLCNTIPGLDICLHESSGPAESLVRVASETMRSRVIAARALLPSLPPPAQREQTREAAVARVAASAAALDGQLSPSRKHFHEAAALVP